MDYGTFTEFFRKHAGDFDALLFDVDGTLSIGKTPIPGTKELLTHLNSTGFPYLLLTNDACNATCQKAGYLNKAGIPVVPSQVLSAGNALKSWADKYYHGGTYFQLGKMGDPSFTEAANIAYTTDPSLAGDCCGVIAGEGIYDWQPSVEAAFNLLLKHPEYPLIVCNPDSYWPSMRIQGFGIGSGAMARFICQVLADAGKTVVPTYLGKPYAPIYDCVMQYLQQLFPQKSFSDPRRCLMVGDSLTSDIAGANACGMGSALVLTGITGLDAALNAPPEKRPGFIFKSI